jgi:transcription initiation factor TFIIIB Brf1 subunit/transcription initiation factor TFIIB
MHHMQCEYCGYQDYFDEEEDTGKLYCLYCGHYVDIEILVVE